MKKGIQYKFNIINLMKMDSLYNQGLRVLLYSTEAEKKEGLNWHRGGENICYFQNNLKKKNSGFFNTLTFTHTFQHEKD